MEAQTLTRQDIRDKTAVPKMYAVIMYNDPVTTMDFVVELLVRIFHKSPVDAASLMMRIHEEGQGIVGVYAYDIAVTKKIQADRLSAEKEFPLKLTVQPCA